MSPDKPFATDSTLKTAAIEYNELVDGTAVKHLSLPDGQVEVDNNRAS